MQVPLDWSEPGGAKISLFMTKIKSTSTTNGSGNKIGSLLWNPGGPGVTASITCQLIATGQIEYFSPALYEHFDIIPQLFVDDAASFQRLADWNRAFGNSCWLTFGLALNQSLSGNATLLSTTVQTAVSNDAFSGIVIGCLDWTAKNALFPEHQALQQLGSVVAPHTLGANQFFQHSSWCINWPVPIANPPHWLNAAQVTKLPPDSVLLVNAEFDPETWYMWAQGLKDQLTTSAANGDSKAVVLMRKGDGHTSYAIQGQAARIMDAFWVNRTVPGNGTVVDS
ncbi:uncharacterized protein A1O5_12417 [Cladophialophora psammophila CBS 110553]|uniref:Peptidase S33 tripeptidyl aminopeptidase-like C-terminal domain-containing protein n=1 Tax=Cladophialophora psammophila CBS 110553 TaxID=1182543 RepID=W9WH92_9EURO|nr:uncharacterized protein A1O5_12417 [Cladophialophora psammophila CBS 110553]EXJ57859.1 hypothetical protein A1O5_12417 [Cladophialophora psammophila CBS 110553]